MFVYKAIISPFSPQQSLMELYIVHDAHHYTSIMFLNVFVLKENIIPSMMFVIWNPRQCD